MAWNGLGDRFIFIFDDDLFLYNVETGEVVVLLQDDAAASHPSWAPYGSGIGYEPEPEQISTPNPTTPERDLPFREERLPIPP